MHLPYELPHMPTQPWECCTVHSVCQGLVLNLRHARKCESHADLQDQLMGANCREVTRAAIGVSHCEESLATSPACSNR